MKIRRASFVPPVFEVLSGDRIVGRISFLRNKYEIDLGEKRWILRIRLFSVLVHADSKERTDVWIRGGPWDWFILLRPGSESEALLCSLAFIHWEHLNYS